MFLSILIPTHNRRELLSRTLDSLAAVEMPDGMNTELVIVANNCTDGTEEAIAEQIARFPFEARVLSEPTPGLNNARNRGVAEARGDWLAFLDDDVWVSATWLEGLVTTVKQQKADFLGGHVELWWEAVERPSWLTRDMEWMLSNNEGGSDVYHLGRVGGLVGANFAVKRTIFNVIGVFRPDLDRVGGRLLGGGESDLVQRALGAGFTGYYAPKMSVKHWVAPHRVTPEYLKGVSQGYGYARVMMKQTWELRSAIRVFAGHFYLFVRHGLAGLLGRPNSIRHQCLAAAGSGGLAAAWDRVCRRAEARCRG